MGRRTLLLIASILLAAVGTALVGLYVRSADDRARGNAAVRQVLVAATTIEAGTAPDEKSYQVVPRRAGDLPPTAITAANQITGRAVGRVLPGQVLQTEMFSTEAAAGDEVELGEDHRAVSIDIGDPQRTASLLGPGSQVNIFVTTKNANKATTKPVFLEPITVLGVGDDTSTSGGSPGTGSGSGTGAGSAAGDAGANGTTVNGTAGNGTGGQATELPLTNVTLKLTLRQSRELIEAQANGEIYFAWAAPAPTPTPTGAGNG